MVEAVHAEVAVFLGGGEVPDVVAAEAMLVVEFEGGGELFG